MSGHLFRSFYVCKSVWIFLLVMQALTSATIIAVAIIAKDTLGTDFMMISVLCYGLVFFIASISNTDYFKCDEYGSWVSFVASTPLAAKGQVAGKYYTVLIINFAVLFICFVTDIVKVAIIGNTSFSAASVLVFLFSAALVIESFEIPFFVRLGAVSGNAIKGIAIAAVGFLFVVYILFGDVSFFLAEDPVAEFMKFLESPAIMWILAIFPFAAVGLYALSYRISLVLYRKGAENYGA